ncbi:MAG: hypothetical protein JWM49_633 [Microbacteriaceae bacterium]|nr:hypothetical protein [Microbacteriaceae bacterium]
MTNLRCLPDGQIVETDNFYTESRIRLLWKLSDLDAIQMDDVDGYLHLEHSNADLIVLDPLPAYLESELGDEYVRVTVNRHLGRVAVETSADVYDEVRFDIATLLDTTMFCNRPFTVSQLLAVVSAALIEFDVVLVEVTAIDEVRDRAEAPPVYPRHGKETEEYAQYIVDGCAPDEEIIRLLARVAELEETDRLFEGSDSAFRYRVGELLDGRCENAVDGGVTALIVRPDTSG